MKKFLATVFLLVSLVTCHSPLLFAQAGGITQPIVASKFPYAGVSMSATGNVWTAAQTSLNYQNAIVHWVTAGGPASCTLHFLTGPTIALATLPVDDPNYAITCTSSGEHVIGALNNYFQINVSAFDVGSLKSVTVYVTLTNFAGNALNQTVSTVTQGAGAASPGAYPWYVYESDGTNNGPVGDASARSKYVILNDGSSHYMPAGDAQARAINFTPGNGTDAFKAVKDGVGALGAGVQQVAEIGTLSAAASTAGTALQVVAAPGTGSIVLLGVWLETATNSAGSVVVEYGTGSNCITNPTTIVTLGPATTSSPLALGYYPIHALVTAQKALCLVTDATTTSARALTQ